VAGPQKRRNTRKRSCRRHSVDGRRSGPGNPPSLTRWWWKRSWLLAITRVSGWRGARQGASEVDRQLRARSRTPRRGGAAFGRMPGSSLRQGRRGRERVGQSWSRAPSSARPAGVGSSKGGLAPLPGLVMVVSATMGAAGGGQPSESCAPGSRAIRECSGCESVAEVGEKHLSRSLEGSREANRERARVTRGGGPVSLTRAARIASGDKGAGRFPRERNRERKSRPTRSRDRASNRRKASWAPRSTRLLTGRRGQGLWRGGEVDPFVERRRDGGERGDRRSRGSTRRATEDARGRDVRCGSPS